MERATPLEAAPSASAQTEREAVIAAVRAAGSAPTTWLLAFCIGSTAAWNARALTLPRPVGPLLGPMLVGVVWIVLYAALVLVYASVARSPQESACRLARRIGVAISLALVSTEALRVAVSPLLRPLGWPFFHYLRLIVAPALVLLWCAALLPHDTPALLRSARRRETTVVVSLAALLLVAAVLVSASDLAFQLVGSGSAIERQLAKDVIEPRAWATTTLILFVVLALLFAATSSATTAALLVGPVFATMVFATVAKIRYIHSAVQPLDVFTLPEFLPLFGSFFGGAAIVASLAGVIVWLAAVVVALRRTRTPMSPAGRGVLSLASVVLLAGLIGLFLPPERLPVRLAARADAMHALTVKLGAPPGPFRETARSYGIVLSFLSELRSVFVAVPAGYSAAEVARVQRGYASSDQRSEPAKRTGGVNLVIYLVESLMDLDDFGLRYTAEPMPNFRRIAAEQIHGRAIVPYEYYGSAETEFELLTGMSMSYLPTGSIPFRQYVRRPLPALPRLLHDLGYASIAVQAGPRTYYDRERVEPLLGFDRTIWPYEGAGVARADRGRWPSDDAIVDSVIATSDGPRPFFVFAFPASMHSPYNRGTYARSDLDVLDVPAPAAAELKEYVNAVKVADRAIGRLVEHFRGRSDSTIVVIMGDHLPPFSSDALTLFAQRLARRPTAERALAARATPLLVWANFTLPRGELTLSTNLLPAYLLERIGAPATGLFTITDSVRRTLPVVSGVVQATDGRLWVPDAVPAELRAPLEDYRMLQHDLLLGEQFALRRSDVEGQQR